MKMCNSWLRGLWAVGAVALIAAPAWADPTGDHYSVSTYNLQVDAGPVEVTWDGMPEQVGATMVNERSADYVPSGPGIPTIFGASTVGPVLYTVPGEVLEWSFSTIDGGPFSANIAAGWGFKADGVNWLNMPGFGAHTLDATLYLYLTQNGTPIVWPSVVRQIAQTISGPHPFDPSVPQVIYITSYDRQDYPNGNMSFEIPAAATAGFPYQTLAGLLRVNPMNDVHIGVMINHVPEPSSMALGACGLVALAGVALRRRFRG